MKKGSLLLTAVFLLTIFFSARTILAQESTAAEKEKELKLQQSMDNHKKAMQEALKSADDQLILMDKLARDSVRGFGRGSGESGFYRSRVRSSGGNSFEVFDDNMVVPGGPGNGYSVFYGRGGDSERTTWDYSKQVKESTYAKDLSFDVEKTAKSVSMSLMGDCKTGQIRVKILMPNGKVYSDVIIDESGNLNWRKSFTITDAQNKDKTGEWKFKIEAEKATGYFKISLQTY